MAVTRGWKNDPSISVPKPYGANIVAVFAQKSDIMVITDSKKLAWPVNRSDVLVFKSFNVSVNGTA